jgi:hypothetical protein
MLEMDNMMFAEAMPEMAVMREDAVEKDAVEAAPLTEVTRVRKFFPKAWL